jgi:hypothetical protein
MILGENSGSFLFTRPVKRAYFIWRDWSFGLLQLCILIVLTNLVSSFQVHRMLIVAGNPWNEGIPFSDGTVHPVFMIFCVTTLIVFLLAALIFSLSYFCTVVIKNARGMILSAGVLVGYLFIALRIKDFWPTAELPSLVIQQFTFSRGMIAGFADHLWLSIAIRAAIVLLFPIAAQFILNRADI